MARLNTHPDDLRDRLIAAAYARLQEESPEQMSLRELAASVDRSTNAIYSIFGGKDALSKEVTRVARADFLAAQAARSSRCRRSRNAYGPTETGPAPIRTCTGCCSAAAPSRER